MTGTYEVRHSDGLTCHDICIYIKFHKNWSRHSKVKRGNTHTHRYGDHYVPDQGYMHTVPTSRTGNTAERVGLTSQSAAMHYHTEPEQLSEEVWNVFV
jgi:hypothetical protein